MDVGEVLFFLGLGYLAIQTKHIIAYIAAAIGMLLWGFNVADTDIVAGIPAILFGGYMLQAAIMTLWRR